MLQHLDTIIAFAAIMLGVSILVTVLTQILNSLLGLRGLSLLWGLQTLLSHIDPRLKEYARALSEKILQHPLISHQRKRRASAIRREEFIYLLGDVMEEQNLAAHLQPAKGKARDSRAAENTVIPRGIIGALKITQEYIEGIERWFDNVMERAGEHFAVRSKWISATMSVIVAFTFHLDAIGLIDKLYLDENLRTSLVQSSEILQQRANETFAASYNAFTAAAESLRAQNAEAGSLPSPPAFATPEAARQWLRAQTGDGTGANVLIAAYDAVLEKTLKEKTGRLASLADSVYTDFAKTQFLLIPKPYPELPYNWREVLGMAISSLLLSLGAPFWYNVLKNLSSLRPKLAEIVQRESRERKLPDAP